MPGFFNSQGKLIHFLNLKDSQQNIADFSILRKILPDFLILKVWKAFFSFSDLTIFKILNISKFYPNFSIIRVWKTIFSDLSKYNILIPQL